MDQNRFDQLVEAYGAAPWRWPDDERDAALRFAQGAPAASDRLAKARALDDALDVWAMAAASGTVRDKILKAAPGWRTPAIRQPRFWWAGAGLASACALGVAVGAMAAPLADGREADPVAAMAGQYDGAAPFGGAFDLGAMS